ncbi:MAG TPA: hypothetical protein VIJ79_00240 [Acidobacteriaceae bacterium]
MTKNLGGFGSMLGDEGSTNDQMFGRRAVPPPQRSVSETWSWNSNNPNNIQYNRTVSVTHTVMHDTWEEAQAYVERHHNEWIQQQPTKRPSLMSRIMKALTA